MFGKFAAQGNTYRIRSNISEPGKQNQDIRNTVTA